MINRLPSWVLVLILALLLILPFWLNQSPRAISPLQNSQSSRTPDYVVENFSAILMDEAGLGRHVLLAKKMVHYPDDDSTDLEQPRLIDTQPGKPAMQVKADEARMTSSGEDIYLSGNVMVVRNAVVACYPGRGYCQNRQARHYHRNKFGDQSRWYGDEQPHRHHSVIVTG
jgi:lipopolysaccharide export system protein LptC